MEKIDNRKRFFKELPELAQVVKLTPEFMKGLSEHNYFQD